MDLTIPQYGIRQYDWIISLEVAEHIPEKYEAVYLDNIFRHAKEGIILSWAVPGKGGLSHINNKPIEYVTKVMPTNTSLSPIRPGFAPGFVNDKKGCT
jgi:tryptophanyl-tRNA synthetase